MMMNFNELPEFQKECKRLGKKYKSLLEDNQEFKSDLQNFKDVISVTPFGNSKHFNILTKNEHYAIIKARLFCRYLKGSSLRIIYAFHCQDCKFIFIEIYPKNKKENEDRERIKKYLKDFCQNG